jgi:hypothetical protein
MHKNNGNQTQAPNYSRNKIKQQGVADQTEVRVWVGAAAVGILSLSHLCALSSMQRRETGIHTPMLLDGLVVPCTFSVIAVRIGNHQGAFESPLPSLLQPKSRRVSQRIDIGLVFDDL